MCLPKMRIAYEVNMKHFSEVIIVLCKKQALYLSFNFLGKYQTENYRFCEFYR